MNDGAPAIADPGSPAEEEALWDAFKRAGSITARERLFSIHASFARNIARRHYREWNRGEIDLGDLYQLAYAGLLEAIDRYDPNKNVPFRAFASYRISGSVSDGITKTTEIHEQMAWHRRCRRERLRSLSENELDSITTADAMRRVAEIAVGLALGFMLEGTGLFVRSDADEAVRVPKENAYDSVAWKETITHLHKELLQLPEREQTILRQHYLHGVAFDQIASLLNLSKGRVSQIHRAALQLLRRRMAEKGYFRLEK